MRYFSCQQEDFYRLLRYKNVICLQQTLHHEKGVIHRPLYVVNSPSLRI